MKLSRFLALIVLLCVLGCVGSKVKIDDNLETIPRELALGYLQNESQKYSVMEHCVYTNTGINGFPYDELLYEQDYDGAIRIYRKNGGPRPIWGFGSECNAVFLTIWDGGMFSSEEMQVAVNKTCSALESLGVKRGKPENRDVEFQLIPGGNEDPLDAQAVSFDAGRDGAVPSDIASEEIVAFAKATAATGKTPCSIMESGVSTDSGSSAISFADTCFRAENVEPSIIEVLEMHLVLFDSGGNRLCSSRICSVSEGQEYFDERFYRLGSALLSLGAKYCPN